MSDLSYRKLLGVCMFKASGVLFEPNHTNIDVLGQFSQTLTYGERKSKQQVFVIKGLKNNLLGLPMVEVLKLAARLDSTDSYQARIVAYYPSAFHGVSVLGEPYTIVVDPEAKPYAFFFFLTQDKYSIRFKTKFRRIYLEWSPCESFPK